MQQLIVPAATMEGDFGGRPIPCAGGYVFYQPTESGNRFHRLENRRQVRDEDVASVLYLVFDLKQKRVTRIPCGHRDVWDPGGMLAVVADVLEA